MKIWMEGGILLLVVLGQGMLCAMENQISMENRAWKRGLSFGVLAGGGALLGLAGQMLMEQEVMMNASRRLMLLAIVFLADWLFVSLTARFSSLHPTPFLEKAGVRLGRFLGALLSFVPLPEQKAPEKEIILVKDEQTHEVLENALELNDKTLDEICTHRSEVITLSLKDSPSKWRQTILENRHTFYPVTGENEDDIVGVLDTRDYFRLSGFSRESILKNTMDKPWFAAENTRGDELIRQMKARKNYFAIVLDEYGGMTGIVTLHDVLEELLGEMNEPEDASRPASIVRLPRDTWRIAGSASLDDVSKALGEELHLDDFETFSGYILGTIGYIPEDDTQLEVEIGHLDIQIKSIKNHRIRQTLVRKRPVAAPASKAGSPAPEVH